MDKELLRDIVEVQEGRQGKANWYLEHGYILLDIQSSTKARAFPEPDRAGQKYYVHHNPVYVLGRPKGVESAPPVPPWTPPEEKLTI